MTVLVVLFYVIFGILSLFVVGAVVFCSIDLIRIGIDDNKKMKSRDNEKDEDIGI